MEENKTGKNVSSGAKKVETIEKKKATAAAKVSAPDGAKRVKKSTSTKSTSSKPKSQKSVSAAEKKENIAAEQRLNAAKAKA